MLSDLDYVSQELSVRSVARFHLFPVNGFIDSRKHTDVFLVQQRSWQQEAFTQLSGVNVAMTTIHPSILRPILRTRKLSSQRSFRLHICAIFLMICGEKQITHRQRHHKSFVVLHVMSHSVSVSIVIHIIYFFRNNTNIKIIFKRRGSVN